MPVTATRRTSSRPLLLAKFNRLRTLRSLNPLLSAISLTVRNSPALSDPRRAASNSASRLARESSELGRDDPLPVDFFGLVDAERIV